MNCENLTFNLHEKALRREGTFKVIIDFVCVDIYGVLCISGVARNSVLTSLFNGILRQGYKLY